MVGTVTFISRNEESLPMQGIRSRYRSCPARASWWQNNRSIAQPAAYFCGEARVIGMFPEKHRGVRCCATAFRSPCRYFCPEKGSGGSRIITVCSTYCGDRQELDRVTPWLLRTPSRGTRVASRRSSGTCSSEARPAWTGDATEQRSHRGRRKRGRSMKVTKTKDGVAARAGAATGVVAGPASNCQCRNNRGWDIQWSDVGSQSSAP